MNIEPATEPTDADLSAIAQQTRKRMALPPDRTGAIVDPLSAVMAKARANAMTDAELMAEVRATRRREVALAVAAMESALPDWPWARWEHWPPRKPGTDPSKVKPEKIAAETQLLALKRWQLDRNLFIAGKTGWSKSVAVVAQLRALGEQACAAEDPKPFSNVLWTDEDSVGTGPYGRGDVELIDRAKRCDVLILDEVGQFQHAKLVGAIIAARYNRQAITVITTGSPPAVIMKLYGDTFYRKAVTDCCNGALLNLFKSAEGVR